MKRLLTIVLTLAVIFAALAWVCAPYFAFFALRSAAQSQDVQGLNELVDYGAVRASLKGQLTGTASVAPPSFWQDPVGAIEHAVAPFEPTPKVEALLKPAALHALTLGQGWDSLKARPAADAKGGLHGPWPRVNYWGMNRVRLGVPSAVPGWGETVFTFERQGVFRWKLVHLGMPAKAPVAEPAPVAATPAPAQ